MTTRQEYQKKIEEQIATWRSELESLQSRAKETTAEKREEFTEAVEKLKTRKQELKVRYSELKEASDGAWTDLKTGLDMAVESLGEAIRSAKDRFHHQ